MKKIKNRINAIGDWFRNLGYRLKAIRLFNRDDVLRLTPLEDIDNKIQPESPQTTILNPQIPESKLKVIVDFLITKGWTNEESFQGTVFELNPNLLYGKSWKEIVGEMLKHAREIGVGFQVPFMTPIINSESFNDSVAGKFVVDEEGYVSISINGLQSYSKRAVCAILAHELCHYILENTGIRKKNTLENEKMTDACMFVLGFGKIFLSGYESQSTNYRQGHKLGYLTKYEYETINNYLLFLRQNRALLFKKENEFPDINLEEEELMKKAKSLFFGNEVKINHALDHIKKKYNITNTKSALKKLVEIYSKR